MNRKTKIILIIILIILLVVGGLWMLARNKATKVGNTPPTFKEFVGLGSTTRPSPGGNVDNTLSSEFTNPDEPVSSVPSGNTQPAIPIATSIFTGGGFSPITGGGLGGGGLNGGGLGGGGIGGGGGSGGGIGGGGSSGGGGGGNPGGGGGGGGIIINPPPADPNPPECGPADLYINFTPDELKQLTALKNRFFVVAETLNTDADVATEVANWDTFKSKSRKISELNEYCINSPVYKNAKATVVATERPGTIVPGPNGNTINYRVPTPFWHDFAKDNQAFIHQGSNWMGIFTDTDPIFPERSIEHALRINLW